MVATVEALQCGGDSGQFSLAGWHGHTPRLTEEIGYPRAGKGRSIRLLFASSLDDLAEFAGVFAIEGAVDGLGERGRG